MPNAPPLSPFDGHDRRSLVTVCLLLGGAGNVLTGLAPTPLFLFLVPCTAGLTALT